MEETRGVILGQFRRLGASADWSRTRFTMDEVSSRAVRTAFATLYERGLAYRTEALVNWCPGCKTSVSDLESIAVEESGSIWEIRYPLEGARLVKGLSSPPRAQRHYSVTPPLRCTQAIHAMRS